MERRFTVDQDRMVRIRRELHAHPELGWELARTAALVRRELEDIGIPYVADQYGTNTVVATLGEGPLTIALRADMDALPIQEAPSDKPYQSQNDGVMHACGHDAHTAMLLGAARTLWELRDELRCRVKLLFQPSEESKPSGARTMCERGVMDDVDVIAMCHVNCGDPTHVLSSCAGITNATSCAFEIALKGRGAHVAAPNKAIDALCMGVKVYEGIQMIVSRELDPFDTCVIGVSKMSAGEALSAVAENCVLAGSMRCLREQTRDAMQQRIRRLVDCVCADMGGTGTVAFTKDPLPPAYNDARLYQWFLQTAPKVTGPERVAVLAPSTGAEDFAYYEQKKPGLLFGLGMRNVEKGCCAPAHSSLWEIDEDGLQTGARMFVQLVLDHMDGQGL